MIDSQSPEPAVFEGTDGIPAAPVLTVAEVAACLSIGRNQAYALVASGQLRSIRVGRRTIRVPRAALVAFLDGERS